MPMPKVQGGSWGGERFLMGEVPLYVTRGAVTFVTFVTLDTLLHTSVSGEVRKRFGVRRTSNLATGVAGWAK